MNRISEGRDNNSMSGVVSGNVVRVCPLSPSCETLPNGVASLVLEKAEDLEVLLKIKHKFYLQ